MTIRIKCENPINDMSAMNTYAPRMGYGTATFDLYWAKIKAYTSLIPKIRENTAHRK